jgi:hypothetical protein
VFGLQGFLNTYLFPEARIQEILESILMHHDVSGQYPNSFLDYPQEEVISRAARTPLDDSEVIIRQWFSSTPINLPDVEMIDDQEEKEEDEEYWELDEGLDEELMNMAQ